MKLKIYLLFVFGLTAMNTFAQTVDEILRHSVVVDRHKKIFIEFELNNTFKLSIQKGDDRKSIDMQPFNKDHPYFPLKDESVSIYMRLVNPLNKVVTFQVTYSAEPILARLNAGITALQKGTPTADVKAKGLPPAIVLKWSPSVQKLTTSYFVVRPLKLA